MNLNEEFLAALEVFKPTLESMINIPFIGSWEWALNQLLNGEAITCPSLSHKDSDEFAYNDFLRIDDNRLFHFCFFEEFEWEGNEVVSFSSEPYKNYTDWYVINEFVNYPDQEGFPCRDWFSQRIADEENKRVKWYEDHPEEWEKHLEQKREYEELTKKYGPGGAYIVAKLREPSAVDQILSVKHVTVPKPPAETINLEIKF